ncbi:OmpL47-type beta-barrel domain-containing protein [Clostridium cellulovorans]|nr:fibronectin [Clostridium cellulovorans]
MKKYYLSSCLFLASLLLTLQLVFPFVTVSAATINTNLLPPSNLALELTTPSDVKLTWSSVYGATGYTIYGIIDGQLIQLATTTSTSYTFNNQAEGAYSYVVSTSSGDSESGPCAPVSATVDYPTMAAPATLTGKIQNGNDIALSWTSSQYAQSYNVYQVSTNGDKTLVTSVKTTSYTIPNVVAGSYTYSVSAVNALYGESVPSSEAKLDVIYPVMSVPGNFTYTIANGNDITLKWTGTPYATSYKVYQVINGEKVLKSTVSTTSASYTNMPAGDYAFEVYSFSDRFGESQVGSATSLSLTLPVMQAPSNLTYTVTNGNDITLKWSPSTYATAYNVYQIINGEKVLKSTTTSTTAVYSNLPESDYSFEIYSYSSRFNESPTGSQTSLSLVWPVMQAPENLTYSIANGNDISLKWTAIPYAKGYKVYQIVNGERVLKSTVTTTAVTYANLPAGDYTYEVTSYSDRFGETPAGSTTNISLILPVMEAPTSAIQAIKSATSFTLTWDAVPYATSYKVYQVVNGQKVLKSTVTTTSVSYTNMTAGSYIYEIHSYSTRFGESAEGFTLTFTLNGQVLQAPTNLTYTITNGNDITLKWTAAPYATSYKIYQVINGELVLKKTVTTTAAAFTNMPEGDYYFVVNSVSAVLGESPVGAETTFSLTHPVIAAPGNLTYAIKNGNDITFTWSAVPYANSYKLYELVDGQYVLKTTVTATSATLSNVSEGDHNYYVTAVSSRFGETVEGSQSTVSVVFPTMLNPNNLTYTITSGNNITLNWSPVTYAKSYNVYQIIDGQRVLKQTVTGTTAGFSNMPEGDYTFEVTSASDRFGESQQASTVSLNIVFPVMQAPANFAYVISNGNYFTLSWATVPYATNYKIYQIINGEKVLKYTLTNTVTSLTFGNMPEGDYSYEIYSYSNRFGESSAGSNLSFTLVFPTMQAPLNLTSTILNGNDINLKWTAAPYATAYNIYQIIDGQKVFKQTVTTNAVTFTNLPADDYVYEVYSYATRFGESPVGSQIQVSVIWPVVQAPTVTRNVYNVNNITLTWQKITWANEYRVYEVVGGVNQLLYKGTALTYTAFNVSETTHNYIVTAYSTRFGESVASNQITETIIYPDMQAPNVTVKIVNPTTVQLSWNFITYANGYNIYEIIDGNPVLLVKNLNNLSYTLYNVSYANHQYFVSAYSNSFGESAPSSTVLAKLIVDTTAPVTSANAQTDWTNQNSVNVTLSAVDTETGVANTYYSINDGAFIAGTSFAISAEGITKVSFYSVDKVGNIEATKTIYVKLDRTAPVTISDVNGNWTKNDVTVNLTATDALSGVYKTFYSIDNSSFAQGTSFTVSGEGIHKVTFYSVDKAGNIETATTVYVRIDNSAPVTISDLNDNWSKDDVTVNLTATDSLSGVYKTFYSIDDSSFAQGTSFTVSGEGVHKVTFYSIDNAGNIETTTTVYVRIDNSTPVTISDLNNNWSKDDVTINLTATDALSGIYKTFYSIDDADYVEGTSLTVSGSGIHKVTFYSIDNAGNIEPTTTVYVRIDSSAPVTISDLKTTWSKNDVTVNLTATDALSGVYKTFYSIDGSDYLEGTSFIVKGEGIHKVSFYSVDNVGNIETITTTYVKIDRTAPTISMNLDGLYKLGSTLKLSYVVSDNLSGIASEKMLVFAPNDTLGKEVLNGSTIQIDKAGVYKVIVTATDAAGNTVKIEKQFSVYIVANIQVTAQNIKANNGVFTVRVDMPTEYAGLGFDLDTAKVNGVSALNSNNGYYNQAKHGQFKFNRSDFSWTSPVQVIQFSCYVNGYLVIGETTVNVKL